MADRRGRRRKICIVSLLTLLAAGRAAAATAPNVRSIAVGLSYDFLTRSVVWSGDEAASKVRAHTISAKADFGLSGGIVFSLAAGLSLTGLAGLTYDALPISLQLDDPALTGFAMGAEVAAPLKTLGGFEIGAAGRFVYSFGMSKSWTLEGFAVEGTAEGQPSWMEISAGPRVSYLRFGRIVPYAEVSARLLWAGLKMSESLGDLNGEETKRVNGDFAVALALGADARVTDRITVKAKAGIIPSRGGVDGQVSVGVLYGF